MRKKVKHHSWSPSAFRIARRMAEAERGRAIRPENVVIKPHYENEKVYEDGTSKAVFTYWVEYKINRTAGWWRLNLPITITDEQFDEYCEWREDLLAKLEEKAASIYN